MDRKTEGFRRVVRYLRKRAEAQALKRRRTHFVRWREGTEEFDGWLIPTQSLPELGVHRVRVRRGRHLGAYRWVADSGALWVLNSIPVGEVRSGTRAGPRKGGSR